MKKNKGVVIKISGDKTAKVLVVNTKRHKKYNNLIKTSSKFLIHDENNELKKDNIIEFESCKKISKRKYFRLTNIIK